MCHMKRRESAEFAIRCEDKMTNVSHEVKSRAFNAPHEMNVKSALGSEVEKAKSDYDKMHHESWLLCNLIMLLYVCINNVFLNNVKNIK